MILQFNHVIFGIGVLLLLLTGYWMKKVGKPYSRFIFRLHLIIGLLAFCYLGLLYTGLLKNDMLDTKAINFMITMFAMFGLTMLSGWLVSLDKTMPKLVSFIHNVFPYLTFIALWAICHT